jgi:hypothetical protein
MQGVSKGSDATRARPASLGIGKESAMLLPVFHGGGRVLGMALQGSWQRLSLPFLPDLTQDAHKVVHSLHVKVQLHTHG